MSSVIQKGNEVSLWPVNNNKWFVSLFQQGSHRIGKSPERGGETS